MKYKTTIELITEASDKNEAVEIAGEYLSGSIASGVQMKCASRPVSRYNGKIIASIAVSLAIVVVGLMVTLQTKTAPTVVQNAAGYNAIQPPLKTQEEAKKDSTFKKEWDDKQTKEILNYLKK